MNRALSDQTNREPAATVRNVLVVEDDDDSRELLVELLGLLGHRALGSANASDALRLAEETRPDVVFIDIGLPDASGCDIARSLRASSHGVSVHLVALTGYSDSATRQMAADAGFNDFVVKPFSSERLARLLNR